MKRAAPLKATFFATPRAFRQWLSTHHQTEQALWVGYYKKASGRPSITRSESVDEALCVGWIDGIGKTIDDERYTVRFTPRRPDSNWSAVNIRRANELIRERRMRPAGRKAFETRVPEKSGVDAYDNRKNARLTRAMEARFRKNSAAWRFFEAQPPGYRQLFIWWIASAKQAATQERRLQRLIDASAASQRIDPMGSARTP